MSERERESETERERKRETEREKVCMHSCFHARLRQSTLVCPYASRVRETDRERDREGERGRERQTTHTHKHLILAPSLPRSLARSLLSTPVSPARPPFLPTSPHPTSLTDKARIMACQRHELSKVSVLEARTLKSQWPSVLAVSDV